MLSLNYTFFNNDSSSSLYTAYEQIINDLVRLVKEELTLDTRNLILYGSFAKSLENKDKYGHYFVPGESDIDLILLINPNPTDDSVTQLQKVVESLNSIIFEPIYAPILDLAILESDIDLPNPVGENFNLLHLHSASRVGKVLYGNENYLKSYNYTMEDLIAAALKEIMYNYSNLKNAIIHRDMYTTYELFWMGIDSVLKSSLSFINSRHSENIVCKLQVADYLTSNPVDLDIHLISIVNDAIEYTIEGAPLDGQFEFFLECSKFCRELIQILKNKY